MSLEDADGETAGRGTADAGTVDVERADAAHVVEFELGNEVCAVDIQAVDSIVESKEVTRVPRAPAAVEGVMDLRGETTAIVDRLVDAVSDDEPGDNQR